MSDREEPEAARVATEASTIEANNAGAASPPVNGAGMATGMVGNLTAFDSQTQSWEEYCEVLGHFFEANGIADAGRKRATLLSSVGSKTYSLMRNLGAGHCNFGDKLKEMLRDRLVCGIEDDRMQRRLLAESGLTFDKALELLQSLEAANRDVRALQSKASENVNNNRASQAVYKMSVKPKWQDKGGPVACYRCRGEHFARDCRYLNEKCYGCGKKGHLKKMCKSVPPGDQRRQVKGGGKPERAMAKQEKRQYAHYVEESPDPQSSEDEVFSMHNIKSSKMTKVDPITTQLDFGVWTLCCGKWTLC
ncbi:hypothetical protein SRHO_G00211400 [Serrasalmus rhombeus]